jgi:K+ transporter
MSLRIVDAIIVMVAIEMIAMLLYRRQTHRGMPASEVISFLGAGAGLLLALRVWVADGPFVGFASAMLLALVMHVWHVKQRWL